MKISSQLANNLGYCSAKNVERKGTQRNFLTAKYAEYAKGGWDPVKGVPRKIFVEMIDFKILHCDEGGEDKMT